MQMKLTDFPDYTRVRTAVDKLRSEQQQIAVRLEEIRVELSKPVRRIGGQDAWSHALEGEDIPMDIDTRSSLREESRLLEGQLRFLEEALSTGTMELDRLHGRCSLEICAQVRPLFVKQIHRILAALKELCSANGELETIRSDLERDGVRTDSLPHAIFDVGAWDGDPYGGSRAFNYRRHVSEQYPELEPNKAKRRELAAKSESFEGVEV